jgi:hypothetical protein
MGQAQYSRRRARDYFSVIAAAHRRPDGRVDRDDFFVIAVVTNPSFGIITDV